MGRTSKWNLDTCKEDAISHRSKIDWLKSNPGAYHAALRNAWLEDCCDHMEIGNKTWTLESCKEDASQFKTKSEWIKASPNGYHTAHRHGWLAECTAHMESNASKPRDFWTLERCKETASRHESKTEWKKSNQGAYTSALKNGWLAECTKKMDELKKPNGHWTAELCIENARGYRTKSEWQKACPGAYQAAYKKGLIEKCCAHMTTKAPVKKSKAKKEK
jgi:hypothetical protein